MLTPTNTGLFPWLAPIADRYEKYRFRSLKITWVPLVSTCQSGQVTMFIDYDADDPLPTSASKLENAYRAVSGPVWTDVQMDVNCSDNFVLGATTGGYRYTGEAPVGKDPKFYYSGQFVIAYDAVQDKDTGANIQVPGKFYADYDVELILPQLN